MKKQKRQHDNQIKRKKSFFRQLLGWVEWLLLLLVMGFSAYVFIRTSRGYAVQAGGYSLLHVITGSMEPTIYEDEYVLVRKKDASRLKKGDIIAYYSEAPDIRGKLVIHRIRETLPDGTFILKGDANTAEDPVPVRAERILGQYVRKARFFNWLTSFLNPKKLLLLAVILPLVLLCFYETTSLARLVNQTGKKGKAEEKAETREERVARLKREAVEEYLRSAAGPKEGAAPEMERKEETEEEKIARWKEAGVKEYLEKQSRTESKNAPIADSDDQKKREEIRKGKETEKDSLQERFRRMRVRHARAVRGYMRKASQNKKNKR